MAAYERLLKFLEANDHGLREKNSLSKRELALLTRIIQVAMSRLKLPEARAGRDRIMAETVRWLIAKMYPNKKIILWAHNSHVGYQDIPFKPGLTETSMAGVLARSFRKEMYSIGLYMGKGTTHMWGKKNSPVLPSEKGSLEEKLNQSKWDVSFLNFRALDKTDPLARPFFKPMKSFWWGGVDTDNFPMADQHDGILFVKNVTPPRYIK